MKKFDFSQTPLLLLLILGGAFIYAGLFGNESFLSKLAGIRLSWFSITSTAITVWFLLGWRKIYLGFKENSMDEYETALAARYMRMTFFVVVTIWAWSQSPFGSNRSSLTPFVMPFCTAHATAEA